MGMQPSKSGEDNPTRRNVLVALTGLGSAAIGLLMGIPGVAYIADPLLRASGAKLGRWVRVGEVSGLSEEHPVAVPVVGEQVDAWTRSPQVRLGTVWLRKKGEAVVAYNAECPHLGCKVGYDRDKKVFGCPCHESAFTMDGELTGGPAPRSLDPLQTRVTKDGDVEVRFVRFRAQVAERVEIG